MKYNAAFDDHSIDLEIDRESSTFLVDDQQASFEFTENNGRFFLRLGTKLYKIDNVKFDDALVEFTMDGNWYKVSVKDEQQLLLDKLGFKTRAGGDEGALKSPMPGKILDIMVTEGDEVSQGQPVAILEAMKMENEIKSPIDGIVKKLDVEVGQSVEKRTPIMEIEPVG